MKSTIVGGSFARRRASDAGWKNEEARRCGRKREGPHAEADEAGSRLRHDLASPLALCAVPRSLPVDPEGAKAPLPSPAPYFVSAVRAGGTDRPRAESSLQRRTAATRRSIRRRARCRHPNCLRASRGRLRRLRPRAADLFRRQCGAACATTRRQQVAVLRRSGAGRRAHVRPEREPSTLQGEHQAQASDQLRRRSARVDARAGLVRGTPTDQYLPSTMPGHVKARIYPLTGRTWQRHGRSRTGTGVPGRRFCTRSTTPSTWRRPRSSNRTSRQSGSSSRSNASRSLSCSRSWRRPASRSISAGSTGVASSTPASSDSCSTGGRSATRTLGTGRTSIRRASIASSITRRSSRWDRSAIARTDRSTSSSRGRRLRFRTAYRVPSRWSRRGSAVSS